jgi:hypothetical protein
MRTVARSGAISGWQKAATPGGVTAPVVLAPDEVVRF